MVVVDPFYLDLSAEIGRLVLIGLSLLGGFFFWRKAFIPAGLLSFFIGFLLLYNEINFFIAMIPMYIGLMLILGKR